MHDTDLLVVGVPTHGFRAILADVRPYLRPWIPVVSLAKGFERGSLLRMTQLVREELPGHPAAALTGPNLAKEIMAGQAAASVIATKDLEVARALQVRHAPGAVPDLHQPRCDRMRARRGAEERGGDRDRHRAGAGRGGQHPGRGGLPRAGGGHPAGRRDGRRGGDVLRPGRHGGPHRHLHEPAEPQPVARRAARRRPDAGGGNSARPGPWRRASAPPSPCTSWPSATAWRCRSARRCTGSWPGRFPRRRPTAGSASTCRPVTSASPGDGRSHVARLGALCQHVAMAEWWRFDRSRTDEWKRTWTEIISMSSAAAASIGLPQPGTLPGDPFAVLVDAARAWLTGKKRTFRFSGHDLTLTLSDISVDGADLARVMGQYGTGPDLRPGRAVARLPARAHRGSG